MEDTDAVGAATVLTRGQMLDLILDIESALRNIVRETFIEERGGTWIELIPKTVQGGLLEAQRREEDDLWSPTKRRRVLDFATLAQLVDTISSRWSLFQPLFQDKTMFQAKFGELRKWRNLLAHGGDPDSAGKVRMHLLIEELSSRLRIVIPSGPQFTAQRPTGDPRRRKRRTGLMGATVLWVDDHPDLNRPERRWLEDLGAEVVPVLTNEEAMREVGRRRAHLAISDIERASGESGLRLPARLRESGHVIPVIFYVARLDSDAPPAGAIGITNDKAQLQLLILRVLLEDPTPS